MHAAKDREMTRIADEGLMLWDGESPGTLANVLDLAAQGKDAYLYLAPQAELFRFESGLGLLEWAREYPEALAQAQTRLKQFAKRQAKALGARWDPARKQWYVPAGTPTQPFAKWMRHQPQGTKPDKCNSSKCLGEEGFLCPYRHPGNPFGEYCYATPWTHPYKEMVLTNRCSDDKPWFKG